MLKLKHKLMNEAGEGGDPGAVTDATQAAAAPQDGSLLSQAASAPTDDWIPEKFRSNKDDGTLDLEASARKLNEAYANLEKRFGTGDVPPESVDKYELKDLPDGISVDDLKAEPSMQEFIAKAHAEGLTNKQLNFVVSEFLTNAKSLVDGNAALTKEEVSAELRKTWSTDQEMDANLQDAYKAAATYLDNDELDQLLQAGGPGDNPDVIKLLARIGKELKEDVPPNNADQSAQPDVQALLRSEAYTNPKHPDHKAVSAKVQAHYAKQYGNTPVV